MLWNGNSRRVTFLLGAGATRGAFRHALLNRKRIRAPLNGDFFTVAETLVRAQSENRSLAMRLARIRKVFREEFPTRGEWPIPMEDAFNLLYVSKDFPEIYAPARGRHRQPGVRREIEDFLRLTFEMLGAIEAGAGRDNLYSSLVACLEPRDTIVTLNYDTLLDSALVRAGWDAHDGYGLGGNRQKVKWRVAGVNANPRLRAVKLLKLHGSTNWYVRGNYGKLTRVFDSRPSKVLGPRSNEVQGYIRQVVPPVYGKFFAHSHWANLWTAAHESILESDVIVVIGCSLIDSDFHLRGMLSHAISQRKKEGRSFRAVALVDKRKIRNKWKHLFRGSTGTFSVFKTFESFAEANL